jgi:glycosyltransferase involved in cell wall biosynthesis
VAFAGHRSPAEVADYYDRAAALVLPARAPETFGLVGLEAMTHGLPVIASAIGGITEWLAHEHTGLGVPPNDPGALAAAIDRLVAAPVLGATWGRAGRAVARARFRPEQHVAGLWRIFRT